MVRDEEDLARVRHDAFRGADLAVIEIEQRAIAVDTADADDAEVDLELAEEVDDGLTDHAAIPAADDAASDDDLELDVLAEDTGNLQVVRDDPEAPMPQQRLRHLLRRRADVDEERGIVGNMLSCELRDLPLGLQSLHLPGLIGGVFHARGQTRTTVVALQKLPVAELIDVAPDGLRRHREMIGKRLDRHEAPLMDEVEDLLLTCILRHGAHHGSRVGHPYVATMLPQPRYSQKNLTGRPIRESEENPHSISKK